jgi:hypothetical protein
MLAAYLGDRSFFKKGEMARIATLPVGIQRNTGRS